MSQTSILIPGFLFDCLAKLTKIRRQKTQINKITKDKVRLKKNSKGIQRITRDYFENPYSNNWKI
jgi:hypothetical protein